MKQLVKTKSFWITIAFWATFWPLAQIVPRDDLIDILSGVLIVVSLAVCVLYIQGAKDALWLKKRGIDNNDFVVFAVVIVFMTLAAHRISSWGWKLFGGGDISFLSHIIWPFFLWSFSSAGFLLLIAPNFIINRVPNAKWQRVFVLIVLGAMLGLAAIFSN